MIISYDVYGLEEAIKCIGLSYGNDYSYDRAVSIAERLCNKPTSSGELSFLTGVTVSMLVEGSIKWWQQAERYHFFQINMSESVMHSITHKSLDDLRFALGTPVSVVTNFEKSITDYKDGKLDKIGLIYSVPVSYVEKARVTTNYLQLINMYNQRKNHELDEWKQFCRQVLEMPRMKNFIKSI